MKKKLISPFLALFIAGSLGLSACSSNDLQSEQSSSASQSGAEETPPEVDRAPTWELPAITFDDEGIPSMTPVETEPPSIITVKTLKQGDGATVGADDTLTVNYAGFLWDGTSFDSSYDTGSTASFSLNGVISGWKWGLADTKVGDTVEIVIPSEYGYGSTEQSSIPADSTLVFVVEVVNAVSVSTDKLKEATPTEAKLPEGATITGELGSEPGIEFTDGAAAPTETETIVLAEGTGDVITDTDTVIYYLTGAYWNSTDVQTNWGTSTEEVTGASQLVGQKVGSRIALIVPATDSSSSDTSEESSSQATVVIIDIVAAYQSE